MRNHVYPIALESNLTYQTQLSDEKCTEIKTKLGNLLFMTYFIITMTIITVIVAISAMFLSFFRDYDRIQTMRLAKAEQLQAVLLLMPAKHLRRRRSRNSLKKELALNDSDSSSVFSSDSNESINYGEDVQVCMSSNHTAYEMHPFFPEDDCDITQPLTPDEIELHLKLMLLELNIQNAYAQYSLANRFNEGSKQIFNNFLNFSQKFIKRVHIS
jgi:hypothetical protein